MKDFEINEVSVVDNEKLPENVRDTYSCKPLKYNGFGKDEIEGKELKELSKEELIVLVEKLYEIIDDIDTAGDIAKDNDKMFRALTNEYIDKRKDFIVCDCYSIKIKKL